MFKRLLFVILAAVVALPAAANDFSIDTAHSSVSFKVSHMVVSKTRGSFQDFQGTIHLDQKDISKSSVAVTIEVASIDTANGKRDDHLRSKDFFEAEKFPQITFKSTSVTKRGTGYVATGNLTIKDITRQIELPFAISGPITDPWGNQRVGFQVDPITIDRQDYGLTWSKTLEAGGLVVGDEVTIEIEVEAVQAQDSTGA